MPVTYSKEIYTDIKEGTRDLVDFSWITTILAHDIF